MIRENPPLKAPLSVAPAEFLRRERALTPVAKLMRLFGLHPHHEQAPHHQAPHHQAPHHQAVAGDDLHQLVIIGFRGGIACQGIAALDPGSENLSMRGVTPFNQPTLQQWVGDYRLNL